MVFRAPRPAPVSRISEERRGRVVGRFCLVCGGVYPRYGARHAGKPIYGKDHVAAPCAHEGEPFEAGDEWWEPAVEVLPAPPAPAETAS